MLTNDFVSFEQPGRGVHVFCGLEREGFGHVFFLKLFGFRNNFPYP